MHKSLLQHHEQGHPLSLKIIVAVSLCAACICVISATISTNQTTELLGIYQAPFPIMRGQLLWNLDTGIAEGGNFSLRFNDLKHSYVD